MSLTAQQPWNNVVRTAVQALAAVLGGAQSLHTNALDEALALPTEDAALLALRTQQILAHETGLAEVVDPLGGSYCIERLTATSRPRRAGSSRSSTRWAAWWRPSRPATRSGRSPRAPTATSRRWRAGRGRLSGSTRSSPPRTSRWSTLYIDEAAEQEQRAALDRLRRERDGARVEAGPRRR